MSPETHLLASWLVAARATRNSRDCRLVALAGILPDADGLGLLVDGVTRLFGSPTSLYQQHHHWLLHGIFGACVIAGLLGAFAIQRWRVALLAFTMVHLHLLCDLLGSRGPTQDDLWPVYYLGPFSREFVWNWAGQWRLDGWQNRYITLILFAGALWLPLRLGHSVVGVFNRRADQVFVEVLRKWKRALEKNRIFSRLRQPPWRVVIPALCGIGFLAGHYALWEPGLNVRDGRNDRRHNALWLSHGWLGADSWFEENHRTNQSAFRDPERLQELHDSLRQHHITDVFPHLCPSTEAGALPAVDAEQVERFLDALPGIRVMPWIGGPNGFHVRYDDERWRVKFLNDVRGLFVNHPRLAGIHLNVEPVSSGDTRFLDFLDALRSALPSNRKLSVAFYPPPTRWHPYPDAHWDEDYFRAVARRSDQVVVMMYDTGLRVSKLYQKLMADWTLEVLDWCERKPVLLGIPTYDDENSGYHDPKVENLANALRGIHGGLSERPYDRSYQGIALYAEWTMDESEWEYLRHHFLKP